jgi:hypothetical protein
MHEHEDAAKQPSNDGLGCQRGHTNNVIDALRLFETEHALLRDRGVGAEDDDDPLRTLPESRANQKVGAAAALPPAGLGIRACGRL